MIRIPQEVAYVEDELGVFLCNLGTAELSTVKKACETLLAMPEDDRDAVYAAMEADYSLYDESYNERDYEHEND